MICIYCSEIREYFQSKSGIPRVRNYYQRLEHLFYIKWLEMIYLLSERISSVRPRLLFLGLFILLPWSVQADDVLYERDVRPILKAHCFHCHGEEGVKEANLDLRLAKFIKKGGD